MDLIKVNIGVHENCKRADTSLIFEEKNLTLNCGSNIAGKPTATDYLL